MTKEQQQDITVGKQMECILSGAQRENCIQKEGYLGGGDGEVSKVKGRNGPGIGADQLEKSEMFTVGVTLVVDGEWTSLV